MRKPNYRLCTDEVERLVKEETERRRKLRIVQVREQAKANAALIRDKVKSEKEKLLKQFADEVKNELEAEKAETVRKLQQKYDNTLRSVGHGHREVHIQGDGQNVAAQKFRLQESNRNAAEERFRVAVRKQGQDKAMQEWEETRHIRNRDLALDMERDRAAAIAALPPPPPDISAELEKVEKRAIPMTDMKAFATTHYHIPDFQVVKATQEEQMYDAKALAQESDLRLKQDLAEKKRSHHEQTERARIRGNEALQREMLKHDLGDMLQDLSFLQRKDRRRRQNLVSDVPKQVFIPAERCMEDRADLEIEMERKFEDIYLKQNRSDSGSTRVWSELPTTTAQESSGTEASTTHDSSAAFAGVSIPSGKDTNAALRDLTNLRQPKPASGKQPPETVLKQLLDKIKQQRSNVTSTTTGGGQTFPAGVSAAAAALSVSSSLKPTSEFDNHSVMSAESRASWKKSEDAVDDKLAAQDGDEMDGATESSSGMDGATLSKTSVMIGELQQRIRLIDNQKRQLSDQLQSQTEFYEKYQSLKQQQQQELESHECKDDDDDASLQEVSLSSSQSQKERFVNATPADSSNRFPPSDKGRPGVDLSSAVSNLRPVFGILKGPKNQSYELLTSNGFLPSPDTNVPGSGERNVGTGVVDIPLTIAAGRQGAAGGFGTAPAVQDKAGEKSARRMIEFKGMPPGSASLISGRPLESSHSDLARDAGRRADSYFLPDETGSSSGGRSSQDDQMGRRMRDYQARAQNIQSGLDEDTLTKVREYQNRLLQTHEERKEFLSNVRSDIERRREALHNTARSSTGMESHLMHLGIPPPSSSSASYALRESKTEIDGRHAGEQRYHQNFEPIAPFIADSWGNTRLGVRESETISGGDGFRIGSSETLKAKGSNVMNFGDNNIVSRRGVGEELGTLDGIRRSLPFDDLNDSNFDTSAVRDNVDDYTPATSRSHGLSDDSKLLLSSEEDRGSPILTGNRSDRFDTSDKSTNNSVTGSSSLNGSALVARAEERREGFERRQEELRRQLTEIQDQKDAILQRYYQGQQALQQQQESLKTKLASSVSTFQPDDSSISVIENDFQQRAQLRDKLSHIRSQVEPDSKSDYQAGSEISGQTSDLAGGSASPTTRRRLLNQFQISSDDRLAQAPIRRSIEFPMDSYLDDISYHQIRDVGGLLNAGGGLSSSLERLTSLPSPTDRTSDVKRHTGGGDFKSRYDTSDSMSRLVAPPDERHDDRLHGTVDAENGVPSGMKTWASVLLSNRGSQRLGDEQQNTSGEDDGISIGKEEQQLLEGVASSGSRTPPAMQMQRIGIYPHHQHHEPHELSTILEMDTPTTGSVMGGSTNSNVRASASASASSLTSLSNPSLSHGGSTLSLVSRWDSVSDTKMDRFMDPPYTFPTGGGAASATTYDLASSSEIRGGGTTTAASVAAERGQLFKDGGKSGIFMAETSKAARSLHFPPPEIEFTGMREFDSRRPHSDVDLSANSAGVSFHSDAITLQDEEEDDDLSLQSRSLMTADAPDLSFESRSISPADQFDVVREPVPPKSSDSLISHSINSHDGEVHVDVGEEELSSMAMPDLVGLTPIRPHYQAEGGSGF